MPDQLTINNLQVLCKVGCTKEERSFPQKLHITLNIETSFKKAVEKDDLLLAVDYAAVIETVRARLLSREFNLIETIAEDIATDLLKSYSIDGIEVSVSKSPFPNTGPVTAKIYRHREPQNSK